MCDFEDNPQAAEYLAAISRVTVRMEGSSLYNSIADSLSMLTVL